MPKTVLITGASRGIGSATALFFAEHGYQLSICCKNSADRLQELAQTIRTQFHCTVLSFIGDVGDCTFVEAMISDTLAQLGSIDILINNAGISYIGLLQDMSAEEWNHLISTNLTSVFLTSKAVIPAMLAAGHGKIINISSVWGSVGASCEVAYSACKGGINSLTKALGKELAPSNIQVNAIACGVIDTEMNHCFSAEERAALAEEIPTGRFGTAEETASFIYSVATSCDYLTGQVITLDGGWM